MWRSVYIYSFNMGMQSERRNTPIFDLFLLDVFLYGCPTIMTYPFLCIQIKVMFNILH